MAQRLTEKVVRELPVPASGNRIHYDADLPGFGVRVTSAGARAFILNYRHDGRERRLTIGAVPAWTVPAARKRAEELRREIDQGRDPLAARDARRTAPTMADLAARYVEHAARHKRPRSLKEDQMMISGVILPALRDQRVADLHRTDVEKLFREVADRAPIRANRVLSLLRRMLNLAAVWELREAPNPATKIERNQETHRERYMTPEELIRLSAALATHSKQQSANIVRLALLTGARRGEVLGATWGQFDLDAGVWTKPAATTKQAKEHRLPLSAPARQLLAEMRAEADKRRRDGLPAIVHLFPGYGANDSQGDLKRSWASICVAADLKNLRFHDLRHTYASILVSSGLSLPIIGALLGHTQVSTTNRYAHLMDDPLRAATERAGAIIAGAGKDGGEVVPIRGAR